MLVTGLMFYVSFHILSRIVENDVSDKRFKLPAFIFQANNAEFYVIRLYFKEVVRAIDVLRKNIAFPKNSLNKYLSVSQSSKSKLLV